MPLKVRILKNWLKWLLDIASRILKNVAKEGGKICPTNACPFYHVFFLFLSLFLILFLRYFSLSSFCFLALGSFLSMVIAPIYNGLIL